MNILFMIACSSSEKTSSGEYQDDNVVDTALFEQGTEDASDFDGNAETSTPPTWWKMFAEIQWDSDVVNVLLKRSLLDNDLHEICVQDLVPNAITRVNSPTDSGVWFSMDVSLADNGSCFYERDEETITLGVSDIYPDIEIALDMVDWTNSDEEVLYSESTAFGGYLIFGDSNNVLAFGAAYAKESIDTEEIQMDTGNWVLRPVYSFKW